MQLSFEPARLTGFAILAVAGATALTVGACGSSNNAKPPATSSPASAKGGASVSGMIESVSGNSVKVTQESGTTTVNVTPKTKITEYTKAQLSDIAAGNCVSVVSKPPSSPGGAVTAKAVQQTPPGDDGKCLQPKTNARKVIGTVASVSGNTINVSVTDANGNPAQTEVNVTDSTRYSKHTSATSQALAQGKCINANGKKDSGGTLQATIVGLGPADDGKCPQPAAPEQHPH